MTNKHDGGPAFPVDPSISMHREGMSLRDYFAGLAMQGLIAGGAEFDEYTDYAKSAYLFADTMLEARKS